MSTTRATPLLPCGLALGCALQYRTESLEQPPMNAWSSAPPGAARICAVKPQWRGGTIPALIHDDGKLVAALGRDSYVCWLVSPGVHHIHAQQHFNEPLVPVAGETITAHEGGRYYLRCRT